MTILEALKSKVKYPLSEDFFQSVLIERGLSGGNVFNEEVATGKAFRLCRADCYIGQVDAPQIQEGSVAISLTDKSNFITLANAIYREYGELEYGKSSEAKPKVTPLEDW